jgi:hypothetical protein
MLKDMIPPLVSLSGAIIYQVIRYKKGMKNVKANHTQDGRSMEDYPSERT